LHRCFNQIKTFCQIFVTGAVRRISTAVCIMAATVAARSLGKLKQQNVALFVCDLQVQQQLSDFPTPLRSKCQLLIRHQCA
jgi:hypothetical protein